MVKASSAALVVVDIQEKLAAAMDAGRLRVVLDNAIRMIRTARALSVPILVTEQYPRGLGRTLTSVAEAIGPFEPIEKLTFSAMGVEEVLTALKDARVRDVLVVGMEAHVCVAQTVFDLEALGFRPVVLADAVISRYEEDCAVAIERLGRDGVTVATTEAAIFEMLEVAGTEAFKTVRQFVRKGSARREEDGG